MKKCVSRINYSNCRELFFNLKLAVVCSLYSKDEFLQDKADSSTPPPVVENSIEAGESTCEPIPVVVVVSLKTSTNDNCSL